MNNQQNRLSDNTKIYLAILNITSWVGISCNAEHLYGHLILCEESDVNIDNIEDYNVKYVGENIEIRRPLTFELATLLDQKDGYGRNLRRYRLVESDPEFAKENPEYITTNRFDTFDQIVNAGIEKWRELNIDCPFISLYNGEKYYANSYNPSATIILRYGE